MIKYTVVWINYLDTECVYHIELNHNVDLLTYLEHLDIIEESIVRVNKHE